MNFYTFECVGCGCVYEIIGTPSPEDLHRPLCPSCAREQEEHKDGCDSESITAPDTGSRSA